MAFIKLHRKVSKFWIIEKNKKVDFMNYIYYMLYLFQIHKIKIFYYEYNRIYIYIIEYRLFEIWCLNDWLSEQYEYNVHIYVYLAYLIIFVF